MATVRVICLQNKPEKDTSSPTLEISNFGLSTADLNTVLMLLSDQYQPYPSNNNSFRYDLLSAHWCRYMYIRKPEMLSGFRKIRSK
jgi:hypothetical protein